MRGKGLKLCWGQGVRLDIRENLFLKRVVKE